MIKREKERGAGLFPSSVVPIWDAIPLTIYKKTPKMKGSSHQNTLL